MDLNDEAEYLVQSLRVRHNLLSVGSVPPSLVPMTHATDRAVIDALVAFHQPDISEETFNELQEMGRQQCSFHGRHTAEIDGLETSDEVKDLLRTL